VQTSPGTIIQSIRDCRSRSPSHLIRPIVLPGWRRTPYSLVVEPLEVVHELFAKLQCYISLSSNDLPSLPAAYYLEVHSWSAEGCKAEIPFLHNHFPEWSTALRDEVLQLGWQIVERHFDRIRAAMAGRKE
jgi:hypothetical protein